jgi:protein gp37
VWTGKIGVADDEVLTKPLRWKRPRLIFTNSTSDLFHDGVPETVIDRIFAVMALAPKHTFQVLTKRAARMREYLSADDRRAKIAYQMGKISATRGIGAMTFGHVQAGRISSGESWPLPNVWLGVSAERQQEAAERVPLLVETPAAVRWISAEPLLGPIELEDLWGVRPVYRGDNTSGVIDYEPCIDWVVVGGESGAGARAMHPDWARDLRDQCAEEGVPFFFKQWGEWGPGAEFHADPTARKAYRGEVLTLQVKDSRDIKMCIPTRDTDQLGPALTLELFGKKSAGRLLDGRTHDAMPEVAA